MCKKIIDADFYCCYLKRYKFEMKFSNSLTPNNKAKLIQFTVANTPNEQLEEDIQFFVSKK